MAYAPIKNLRFNWETENHSFTFNTCGDRLAAYDSLSDIIGSLEDLRDEITMSGVGYSKPMPMSYKVRGNSVNTWIEAKDD